MAIPLRVGRLWSRYLGNLIGYGIGVATGPVWQPVFRDLAAEINNIYPNERLTPETLAMMVVQGIVEEGKADDEAQDSGINSERFQRLIRLSSSPPGFGEMIDLWRRGEIDDADVRRGLKQAGLKQEWIGVLLRLRRVLLSPDSVASMVGVGILGMEDGKRVAARGGVMGDDFESLVRQSQVAPPVGEVLTLLNRGQMSENDARAALRRNGLEQRYIEDVLALRFVLPSPSDLVRFAVREVFTPEIVNKFGMNQDFPDEAMGVARRIGLREETMRQYWAAHWDLPSPTQGFEMFHRGIINKATLEQLLRALDVMPYWRERVIDLAYNVPGRIDLRRMFEEGVIDRAEVLRGYLNLGYSPKDAEILTTFAVRLKMKEERDLSKSEVTALYEARAITERVALDFLNDLGYDNRESRWILDLADFRRERSYRTQAMSVIRQRFIDGEISESEVSQRLDALGLSPDERDDKIDLWSFERSANPRRLTAAESRTAWLRGLQSEDAHRERLLRMNYPPEEVDILIELARPRTAG